MPPATPDELVTLLHTRAAAGRYVTRVGAAYQALGRRPLAEALDRARADGRVATRRTRAAGEGRHRYLALPQHARHLPGGHTATTTTARGAA